MRYAEEHQIQLHNRKKQRQNAGFSLIELLIAVVIIGIVAAPILHAFFTSANMTGKSKKLLRATTAGQNIMEKIKGTRYKDLVAATGDVVVDDLGDDRVRLTYNQVKVSDETYKVVATLDPTEYKATTAEAAAGEKKYNDTIEPEIFAMDSETDGSYMPAAGIASQAAIQFSIADAYSIMEKNTTLNINTSSGKTATLSINYTANGETKNEVPPNTYLFRDYTEDGKLRSIYIFFEPLYTAVGRVPKEHITINNTGPDPVMVYLVKQKAAGVSQTAENNYAVDVKVTEPSSRVVDWTNGNYEPMTILRTNLNEDELKLTYSGVVTAYSAETMVGLNGITGGVVQDKLYKVEVVVYDKKGKEVARINGTKER